MLGFYGTVIGLFLLIILFIGGIFWTIGRNRQFFGILGVFLAVLLLGLWVNSNLLNWYRTIQQKKDLQHAKEILRDPIQFKELLQHLQNRVKVAPKDAKAWFLLGRLYAQNGEWPAAHDALLQAHRLAPLHIKTSLFYVETVWHTQKGLTPYARSILKSILEKEPQQPDALVMLAADAKSNHCYAQALTYLNQLISLIPKESPIYQDIYQEIQYSQHHIHEDCVIKKY